MTNLLRNLLFGGLLPGLALAADQPSATTTVQAC
jgi:hypothetical protein